MGAAASADSATDGSIPFDPSEVDKETLEEYVQEMFHVFDEDGGGVLQPTELVACLAQSGFHLSSGTILDIVAAADVNGDGKIEYHEFVPVVRDLMQQDGTNDEVSNKQAAAQDWTDFDEQELEQYLTNLFKIADENGDGVLQPKEYVKLMRLSGLSFSDDVILEGFIEADTNKDGVIDHAELVVAMSAMMHAVKYEMHSEGEVVPQSAQHPEQDDDSGPSASSDAQVAEPCGPIFSADQIDTLRQQLAQAQAKIKQLEPPRTPPEPPRTPSSPATGVKAAFDLLDSSTDGVLSLTDRMLPSTGPAKDELALYAQMQQQSLAEADRLNELEIEVAWLKSNAEELQEALNAEREMAQELALGMEEQMIALEKQQTIDRLLNNDQQLPSVADDTEEPTNQDSMLVASSLDDATHHWLQGVIPSLLKEAQCTRALCDEILRARDLL